MFFQLQLRWFIQNGFRSHLSRCNFRSLLGLTVSSVLRACLDAILGIRSKSWSNIKTEAISASASAWFFFEEEDDCALMMAEEAPATIIKDTCSSEAGLGRSGGATSPLVLSCKTTGGLCRRKTLMRLLQVFSNRYYQAFILNGK